MNAVIIYESLTGNTKAAAYYMADELQSRGIAATVCSVLDVDLAALSAAELVIIGSWTDGLFVAGQKPGRSGRLRVLPTVAGKRCFVYCTFALNPGRVLEKMTSILESRGATVLGGRAIRRNRLQAGSKDFIDAVLAVPVR